MVDSISTAQSGGYNVIDRKGNVIRPMTDEEKQFYIDHIARKDTTEFSSKEISEKARELSGLMDENDGRMRLQLSFGMSEEQLADHFGNIGRKLDEAFANDQISRQEYDDLNKGLEKYINVMTEKAERSAAGWEVAKERMKDRTMAFLSGNPQIETRSAAEVGKELSAEITKFVKEFCSIDRNALAVMINNVRKGQAIFPYGTVQTYKRTNTAGYFKNGWEPFKPLP